MAEECPDVEMAPELSHIDTAVLRVGILRSESETLNNPAWDAVKILNDDRRFRIDVYSERNYQSLLNSQHHFDCIVLAHNVMLHNEDLQRAVSECDFTSGLVILQQREWIDGLTLLGDVPIEMVDFPDEAMSAFLASDRSSEQEVLLNWPCELDSIARGIPVPSLRGFSLNPQSKWRVILQAPGRDEVRMPVLIRSAVTDMPRVVLTTLLLEADNELHKSLLCNIAYFCGAGRPDTVIVGSDEVWRTAVARKLRLRGVAAVTQGSTNAVPSFGSWPLRGVAEVFARFHETESHHWLDDPEVAEWLTNGGRLVRVSEKGRSEIVYQAPDLDWVARRFSSILHARSNAWHQSIMASRAVLTTLLDMKEAFSDVRRFGLPDPEAYRSQVRQLLSSRLGNHSSIDETVSTTTAALDLNRVIPGVLSDKELIRIDSWLRGRFENAVLDDKLEIARSLGDRQLFAGIVDAMPEVASVMTLTRLRSCAHVFAWTVDQLPTLRLNDYSDRELESSVLIAGSYLRALAYVCAEIGMVPDAETEQIDLAISTLRKRGELSGVNRAAPLTLEELAAEVRAVSAISMLEGTSVGVSAQAGQIPPALVDDVLRETAAVRVSNINLETQLRGQERALRISRHVAGTIALGVPALLIALAVVNHLVNNLDALPVLGGGATAIVLLIAWTLSLVDLVPEWLGFALGKTMGLRKRAVEWAGSQREVAQQEKADQVDH